MPKKILGVLALLLAAWYLFTRPEDAADAVQAAWDAVISGFEAIIAFVSSLLD